LNVLVFIVGVHAGILEPDMRSVGIPRGVDTVVEQGDSGVDDKISRGRFNRPVLMIT